MVRPLLVTFLVAVGAGLYAHIVARKDIAVGDGSIDGGVGQDARVVTRPVANGLRYGGNDKHERESEPVRPAHPVNLRRPATRAHHRRRALCRRTSLAWELHPRRSGSSWRRVAWAPSF